MNKYQMQEKSTGMRPGDSQSQQTEVAMLSSNSHHKETEDSS